jgi:hypothetical protein
MILNEVTQRRLERYQESLTEKGQEVRAAAAYNRIVIEAAVVAGIAEDTPDDLLDCSPRAVEALTKRVLEHIREAVEPLQGEA